MTTFLYNCVVIWTIRDTYYLYLFKNGFLVLLKVYCLLCSF